MNVRVRGLLALGLCLPLSGCFLFSGLSQTPAAEQEPEVDLADINRFETYAPLELVSALTELGYPFELTMKVIDRLAELGAKRPFDDAQQDAIEGIIDPSLAANPEPDAALGLQLQWADYFNRTGDHPRSTQFLLAAHDIDPGSRILGVLDRADLEGGAYPGAVKPICTAWRTRTEQDEDMDLLHVFETCKEWVGGDLSQLWEGAEKDYRVTVPKLEKQWAAWEKRDRQFHEEIAVVFPSGGECRNGGPCGAYGWKSYWNANVMTECVDDDCFYVGWETFDAKGRSTTACKKGECLGYGWTTKGAHGSWTGRCKDEDCILYGWTVKKGGRRYDVTSEDEGESYTVKAPNKHTYTCVWIDGNIENGIECEEND